MLAIINESNLNEANEQGQVWNGSFNCWGATLYILGKVQILEWINRKTIEKFLKKSTYKVKEAKKGDILVLYAFDKIIHTAIYIENNKLFHKRGGNVSEFTTVSGVKDCYYVDYYEIRRLDLDKG